MPVIKIKSLILLQCTLVLAPSKPHNPAYRNVKAFLVLLLEGQVMKADWTHAIITV